MCIRDSLLSTKRERSFSDSELQAQFIIKLSFDESNLLSDHQILTGEDFNKIVFESDTTKGPKDSYGITDQLIDAFTRSN